MRALSVLSHTQYVLINRLTVPLGGFVLLIIIARHSDTLLGQYALVTTIYFVMQMLPLLGLTTYVMREVARAPEQAGRYFMTIGALSLLGCAVVVALSQGFLHIAEYKPQVNQAIQVVAIIIFPGILAFIAEIIFMSLHRAKPVAQVAVVENLVRVIVSVFMLHLDGGIVSLMWVLFFTRMGALLAYLVIFKRSGAIDRFGMPDTALIRKTLGVLPTFLLGAVVFTILSRMDFLILSLLERVELLGYYAIGYRLFEVSLVLLTALVMAMFPWISRKFIGVRMYYLVAVKSMLMFFACVLMITGSIGVLFAEYYVLILFSDQYPESVLLTQLFLAALFIAGMDYLASGVLHASDQQTPDVRAMTVGGIIFTGLLLYWVPLWSIYGAFAARLAAVTVQGVMKYWAIERKVGVLWGASELLRLCMVLALLSLLTLSFLNAGLPAKVLLSVFLIPLVPLLMLVCGLLQPLRLLRFYHKPGAAKDVTGVNALIDMIVADSRQRTISERKSRTGHSGGMTRIRGPMAVVFYRVARYLYLIGYPRIAVALSRINSTLLGVQISPEVRVGSGLVIFRRGPVVITKDIGDNAVYS